MGNEKDWAQIEAEKLLPCYPVLHGVIASALRKARVDALEEGAITAEHCWHSSGTDCDPSPKRSKAMSKATEESNQQYFHSLHQLPELRLRVGETRNETGGRVWTDTGEPSVPIVAGCRYCENAYAEWLAEQNAYAEWLAAQIHGDGTTSVSLGLGQTVLDVEAEREPRGEPGWMPLKLRTDL